jgi:hypothetical protein
MNRSILGWVAAVASRMVGLLAFIAIVWAGYAQEQLDAGKARYTNAVVTGKTPSRIHISHAQGKTIVRVADFDTPPAGPGVSPPSRTNTPAAATPATRPNLIMKKRVPDMGPEDKLPEQLLFGTWGFVAGFFFICNIVRPILNGFLFKIGYFIYFGTGMSLMALVEDLRKHGLTGLTDSWLGDSCIALLNILALVALFRIGVRVFAVRAAGHWQHARVRWTPAFWIISLTDFIQLGVYAGCYVLGPVIYLACR